MRVCCPSTSLTLFVESSYFSCLSCTTDPCHKVRSWMHGLWVPNDCQPLVITQKEELEIIQSYLQCLVLDYFSINGYFWCQLEFFLLFWCYLPFLELLYELYSMNMGKSITVIVYIVYTVLYCKIQYI